MEMPRKSHQYAKRAKVLKYVKVGDGWRFARVVERHGKIVRDHFVISDRDEHHPEGTYYLEWYEIGNRRRRKAMLDFADLIEQARLKAIEVDAMRARPGGATRRARRRSPRATDGRGGDRQNISTSSSTTARRVSKSRRNCLRGKS
jgi:hypothetical protein